MGQEAKLSKTETRGAKVPMKVPRANSPYERPPGMKSPSWKFGHPLILDPVPTSARRT